MFDHKQASLLFARYAEPYLGYSQFCRLLVPCDPAASERLLARVAPIDKLGFESLELMRRLMRAHLSLAQAQEYIKIRLNKHMIMEGWHSE